MEVKHSSAIEEVVSFAAVISLSPIPLRAGIDRREMEARLTTSAKETMEGGNSVDPCTIHGKLPERRTFFTLEVHDTSLYVPMTSSTNLILMIK